MKHSFYNLSVLVDGKPVHEYEHEGDYYIEGRKGHEYSLKFENLNYNRVKVVFSVDGLNVITGDSTWERGYVIDPFSTFILDGWRKDNSAVNAFYFANKQQSYSERAGKGTSNVGVIGCKVFLEKPSYSYDVNYYKQTFIPRDKSIIDNSVKLDTIYNVFRGMSSAILSDSTLNASNVIASDAVNASLGTGYGEEKTFLTKKVNFDSENTPTASIILYYDDKKNLERRGIKILSKPSFYKPNPFPTDGVPPPIF